MQWRETILNLSTPIPFGGSAILHIRFYVSDPGYGHASRAIALAREIRRRTNNVRISVRTRGPLSHLKRSLGEAVAFTNAPNDVQLHFREGVYCDLAYAYERNIAGFENRLHKLVEAELDYCQENRVDLVLSDIAYYPFEVADQLGIPSVAVSSFLWSWFFQNLLNKNDESDLAVKGMSRCYRRAEITFALPLSVGMENQKRVIPAPLLVRRLTRKPTEFRTKLGFNPNDFVIFLTGGYTLVWPSVLTKLATLSERLPSLRIILSASAPLPETENVRKVPADDTETQDYVAASDLVVSKPGHSLVSEALGYGVPLILTLPTRHPEWGSNLQKLLQLNLAYEISFNDFASFEWLTDLEGLKELVAHLKERAHSLSANGDRFIVETLMEEDLIT